MSSYCLKCKKKKKKKTESINPKVLKTTNGKMMILSNAPYVVVKNQNFLKSNKQKDY